MIQKRLYLHVYCLQWVVPAFMYSFIRTQVTLFGNCTWSHFYATYSSFKWITFTRLHLDMFIAQLLLMLLCTLFQVFIIKGVFELSLQHIFIPHIILDIYTGMIQVKAQSNMLTLFIFIS